MKHSGRDWEWVTRHLPPLPKHRTVRQLRRMSQTDLAERCWAATANADFASMSSAEAWARVKELAAMLEGRVPVDPKLLTMIREHTEHVMKCRRGACEHEHAALVRAGLVDDGTTAP